MEDRPLGTEEAFGCDKKHEIFAGTILSRRWVLRHTSFCRNTAQLCELELHLCESRCDAMLCLLRSGLTCAALVFRCEYKGLD